MCVCLLVCPYVFQEKTIYCCTTIYIVRISRKNYILLHNNRYVFQEKTIYIVLTGTIIYIVAKQLKLWQSVSLETSC
jgi:hypothetical protein